VNKKNIQRGKLRISLGKHLTGWTRIIADVFTICVTIHT